MLAFAMAAAFRGVADPAVELRKNLTKVIGKSYPGKPIVDKLCDIDVPLAPLEKTVTEAIALMRSGTHLEPRKLLEPARLKGVRQAYVQVGAPAPGTLRASEH